MSFAGRIAVITGGASGIGEACARHLASLGARVVIADLNLDRANDVARAIDARAYRVDVGIATELEPLTERIELEVGPIAMLVNSAGVVQGPGSAPEALPIDMYDRVHAINLRGVFAACAAVGSRMAKRRTGAIVNIGSIAGMSSSPLHAYGPMKAAVIQLTQNLAVEWGRRGVRVNCLSPGPVLTPLLQSLIDSGERDLDRMASTTAAGELVLPIDVARAAAFLLSDDARAINGVNLPVDHGWLVANSWAYYGGVRTS